jgi:hypothetical protein
LLALAPDAEWRYSIGPEQQPKLRVTAWRAATAAAPSGAAGTIPTGASAPRTVVAPLGEIETAGDALYFPGEAPIRVCEMGAAHLIFDGEPPTRLPQPEGNAGKRPYSLRRHHVGVQVGGTSYFQLFYRFRAVGPLFFDIGAMGLPLPGASIANGSVGLLLDVPVSGRWSMYGGGGVGGAGAAAADTEGGSPGAGLGYFYGRLGVATRLSLDWTDQIGFECGVWRGRQSDGGDFTWPVPGLFVLHAL